ncbi:MAG: PPC domain-containing DNA-binding protein [Dethiobacteria bacterium]
MKFSEGRTGRIFVLRLEQGEKIPEVIESFAGEQGVPAALVFFLGGAERGSKVVVGPEEGTEKGRPVSMITALKGTSEALGFGTLFNNEEGSPKLHMHSAFGREQDTITGCTREGVEIWNIGEVVLIEILDTSAVRKVNPQSGFELLEL